MKKISKLIAFVLVLVLGVILVACGNKGGGGDNTATTVNELTAESGVSASGTFEGGSKLKAEAHAADSEKGLAATSAIDKPYDSARVAVFDITLTKGGEKVQPSGKVKITMPKPFEADEYVTYHVKGAVVEELETAVVGDKISFETTSFSYFVITTNKVAHRTKLNYKGVWAPSATGEPVDITNDFKNGHMIDKAGDSYKIADAVEADTALKLCANFDNYKYDVRAREALGFLFGQDRKFEFCAELRVDSPTGPAIAKWHGYDIYSHEWDKTYDDGKTVSWKQYYYLNFIGEVHPELEYIKFDSVKNVDGYTDENGGEGKYSDHCQCLQLYHYYSKAFKARDLKGGEIVSQIYFDEYYILVIPSYTSTNVHKHSMQHLFWGKEKLTIDIEGQQYEGNIIFVKENVLHTMPVGAQNGAYRRFLQA